MERLARSTTIVIAALCLATAALGQTKYAYPGYGYGKDYLMTVPGANLAEAMDKIDSCNIGSNDIAKALPLLYDLRDKESHERQKIDLIVYDPNYTYHGSGKMTRMEQIDATHRNFEERAAKIWNTITDKIGAEKANCLRDTVEWKRDDTLAYVPSEHMRRIDALIAQWDQIRSTQNAALTPGNTVVEATFTQTTTTPVTTVSQFEPIWISPTVSVAQLVELLENKLVRENVPSDELWMVQSRREGFDGHDIRYWRDKANKVWD
jgi:hypothetical protein